MVLSRKRFQTIILTLPDGTEITVSVQTIEPGKVRLGIDAPRSVTIMWSELVEGKTRG